MKLLVLLGLLVAGCDEGQFCRSSISRLSSIGYQEVKCTTGATVKMVREADGSMLVFCECVNKPDMSNR